jgi:hypothetical protein
MWQAMTQRYALRDCPPATLEGFLQDMLQASSGVLTQCLDDMPRVQMLWVDFENLRTDARQVMRRVWGFLRPGMALDNPTVTRSLDQALARVSVHDGSRAQLPASEPVQRLEKLLAAARQQFSRAF